MSCVLKKSQKENVVLKIDEYGSYTDKDDGKLKTVHRFTWKNNNNITIQVITYGGIITSVQMPDKNGTIKDLVMGYDDLSGYLKSTTYFGATIGRCANRIRKGEFKIDGITYNVSTNRDGNHIHGGLKGFDKVNWEYHVDGTKVTLSYQSADGEEGYPGAIIANVTFELTADNRFLIDYKATTTKPTIVNLTNHSYFNLAGHNAGAKELYNHVVCISANYTTEVDEQQIPTGVLLPVGGTVFDLRIPKVLGDVIDKIPDYTGFDHNFCITKRDGQQQEEENSFVARLEHPSSGRVMEVYSNQPGLQFYNANKISSVTGKNGSVYGMHGAFCVETQNYPDAINHVNFPKEVLYPCEIYHHATSFNFTILK